MNSGWSGMNRTKRVLLIIILSLTGLFLTASLLAYIYRDKVRNIVVAAINKNLTAKIEVGEISFSFIRNFPYATVDFNTIKVNEPKEFSANGTVMNAGKLSLLFNIAGIFSDQYRLKKIILTDASLNLQIDKNGIANYEIWNSKNDSTQKSAFKLELQNVELENVNVLYYNVSKMQDISFQIIKGNLKGDFTNAQYRLETSGSFEDATVKIDEITYLSKSKCKLQLSLDVDRDKGLYTFNHSTLQLSKLTLNLSGKITNLSDYLLTLTYSWQVQMPICLHCYPLIPEKYKANTTAYNYSGNIEFTGKLLGRSDKTHSPLFTLSFKSRDVSLNPKNSPYHLRKMNCTGYFTNRKNNAYPVTYLRLQNFKARLEGKPVEAEIEIENFSKPKINIVAALQADLKAISRFYKPNTLEEISGLLKMNARFNGIAGDKTTYRSSGDIRIINADFRLKQKPTAFKISNGLFHLQGNDLMVEELSGTADKSDFTVNGSFHNLFAWLLSEDQNLNVEAVVKSCPSEFG